MNGKVAASALPASVATRDFNKSNGTTSADHAVFPVGPSMTRQEFAPDCDINTIMSRYENTGVSINGLSRHPDVPLIYADFSSMPATLLEFQTFMSNAEAMFMQLPAVVRKEFDNDPVSFCDFASDPANLGQMRDWGLAPPEKPAPVFAPVPAQGAPQAPSAGSGAAAAPPPAASSAPPAVSS